MMTKYSYFEHSQPSEKPIELPDLEYLEKDVNNLIDWGKDYKKGLTKSDSLIENKIVLNLASTN